MNNSFDNTTNGIRTGPVKSKLPMILSALLVVLVLCAISFFVLKRRRSFESQGNPRPTPTPSTTPIVYQTPQTIVMQQQDEDTQSSIDSKLTELSMEYLLLPGHVPDSNVPIKVAPRPSGHPVYAVVSCDTPDDNTVAIRHAGKYLTVVTPSICRFETRRIGASCFTMVPGFCGQGNDFVMFRHSLTGKFLRASMEGEEEALYTLVCKDAPTTENYRLFCWKVPTPERQNMYSGKLCGCKVDTSGVETCYPCDEDTVSPPDTIGPFPELVGFTVDNAKAVLRAKHPGLLTVDVACPADQTTCRPVVYKDRQTVTLFFDPDTGRINRVPSVQVI